MEASRANRTHNRTCLAIVLAAGEGTRMRFGAAESPARRSPDDRCSPMCSPRWPNPASRRPPSSSVPGRTTSPPKRGASCPDAAIFRAARAAGNRACGAGGESRDRARGGRYSDCLRRYAADPAGNAGAAARAACRRRGACGAGLSAGRSNGLWPADHEGRRARSPFARRPTPATSERTIALCNGGIMALAGEHCACHPGADRRPQSQRRILSDRCGRDRARHEAARGRGRSRGGRRARHQHQKPARRSRSGGAAAPAQGGARCRRHAGCAGDGVSLRRHQIRQGRRGRALCGVRREGNGRGRRGHPFVLASCRRACRQGRFGRAVRAAAPRHAARRGLAHRQFRRGQGGCRSRPAPRPIT